MCRLPWRGDARTEGSVAVPGIPAALGRLADERRARASLDSRTMEPRYAPGEVEARWQEKWEAEGLYGAGAGARRNETVRRHAPAAEHLWRADHRPRPPALARGCARPLAPDARVRHPVPAGLRPRGDLDVGCDRADTREGGEEPARSGARGLRRRTSRSGSRATGGTIMWPVSPRRSLARLRAHALHDGRRLLRRRHALVRPSLPPRLDLP